MDKKDLIILFGLLSILDEFNISEKELGQLVSDEQLDKFEKLIKDTFPQENMEDRKNSLLKAAIELAKPYIDQL